VTLDTQGPGDNDVQVMSWTGPGSLDGAFSDQTALKLLKIRKDTLSQRRLAKRRHDLSSAVQSLKFLHELLLEGYRFNDSMASEKIEYVGRAIETLEREELFVRSLLDV